MLSNAHAFNPDQSYDDESSTRENVVYKIVTRWRLKNEHFFKITMPLASPRVTHLNNCSHSARDCSQCSAAWSAPGSSGAAAAAAGWGAARQGRRPPLPPLLPPTWPLPLPEGDACRDRRWNSPARQSPARNRRNGARKKCGKADCCRKNPRRRQRRHLESALWGGAEAGGRCWCPQARPG
jgi:hypothetical protein